jgi:hypothetical protein
MQLPHIASNSIVSVQGIKTIVHTNSIHFDFSFINMDQKKSDLFDDWIPNDPLG